MVNDNNIRWGYGSLLKVKVKITQRKKEYIILYVSCMSSHNPRTHPDTQTLHRTAPPCVGLFIKESVQYKIREDLSIFNTHVFESIFVEIESHPSKKYIIGVIYRPNTAPRADVDVFASTLYSILDIINAESRTCIIMGDMNINLLNYQIHQKTNEYLDNLFSRGFIPVITKPTRVCTSRATLIDHIYTNDIVSNFSSGIAISD